MDDRFPQQHDASVMETFTGIVALVGKITAVLALIWLTVVSLIFIYAIRKYAPPGALKRLIRGVLAGPKKNLNICEHNRVYDDCPVCRH